MDLRVAAAVEIMRTNLDRNVRLADVAQKVGLSETRFEHLFTKETGQNWRAFLKRARLTRAEELLAEWSLSVKLVAFRVGYRHPANFTRAFKAAFGVSPRAFRARFRPTSITAHTDK
jgi:transcriptional regulator GlxA family with amidase domain